VTADTARYTYTAYGVTIRSDTPFDLPPCARHGLGAIDCFSATASFFERALDGVAVASRQGWYRYASLRDGSAYVRWDGVGEFLVAPNGRTMFSRRDERASTASFQVYLFGQALSFAHVRQRLEPLHATAVVVDGDAVAFLGQSGFGKSSLAAAFIADGHRLLTDDLLTVGLSADGVFAYPGAPRIKLFAKVAGQLWPEARDSGRMNEGTEKRILPLTAAQSSRSPARLRAIYVVAPPRDACRAQETTMARLSPRAAFVALVAAAFNRRTGGHERLENQFEISSSLAARTPVKRLVHPRTLARLDEVREAVLADLRGESA
jgi:hypothetical protein